MRYALTSCVAAALLAGCGAQGPSEIAPTRSMARRHASGPSYQFLDSFAGSSDGAHPLAALINVNGTLYGTTAWGGGSGCYKNFGCGTLFSVTTSGQETVLHRFTGGTTLQGGGSGRCHNDNGGGCGTVFSITPSGSEKVLHSFSGPPDGAFPAAGLINVNGTLYGTTREGGDSGGCRLGEPKIGCGTVYSITPSGSENMIYRLVGPATGSDAVASLIDVNGTLYGTTEYGGGGHGPGTVYTVSPSGSGKLLYHFTYKEDVGEAPTAALIDAKGLLYGTASYAGMHGQGTVFSITTTGTVKVVYNFAGADGAQPYASLINVKGTLYGTTFTGGGASCNQNFGCGTVLASRQAAQSKCCTASATAAMAIPPWRAWST
jgi:uncharacterized repeat protein (TIGR03803 family)